MPTPDSIEREHTLATAVARYNDLAVRDAVASAGPGEQASGLDQQEALELLALGEVIARKAAYGRQLAVRSARGAGASWAQIGQALGTTKQSAWEAHSRWIDEQAAQRGRTGCVGLDEGEVAAARDLAGDPG